MKIRKIAAFAASLVIVSQLTACNEIAKKDIQQQGESSSLSGTDSFGGVSETDVSDTSPDVTPEQLQQLFQGFDSGLEATSDFFEWCVEFTEDPMLLDKINEAFKSGEFSAQKWFELTGMTVKVTNDYYTGAVYNTDNIIVMPSNGEDGIQLTFGGDISLADNWTVMDYYKTTSGISQCISPFLIDKMKTADIAMLNNEFCFSTRGERIPEKAFCFIADPSHVSIYGEMGIDIVDLANNHCYDYGPDSFTDTLATLDGANIKHVGAGENIEDAKKPVYYIIEGRKIAYVAATRAEKWTALTPEATETTSGTLRCYEPDAFIEVIKEAKKNADLVIANVHWGTEDSHELEDVQPETGHMYVDAGADLIIGSHAHCLQGIEYYKGVPIFYNLGNFWFSHYDIDTGLVGVTINDDNSLECTFYPATQRDCKTTYVGGEAEGQRIIDALNSYNINATVAADGVVTEDK